MKKAGRPKKPKSERRVQHTITLAPDVSQWLEKQATGNISKSSVIERALLVQMEKE